jgi:hypothetical protein
VSAQSEIDEAKAVVKGRNQSSRFGGFQLEFGSVLWSFQKSTAAKPPKGGFCVLRLNDGKPLQITNAGRFTLRYAQRSGSAHFKLNRKVVLRLRLKLTFTRGERTKHNHYYPATFCG